MADKLNNINEEQLEAVTGGSAGYDTDFWRYKGFCTSCNKWYVSSRQSMYPGDGPFYCICGTELIETRVEPD